MYSASPVWMYRKGQLDKTDRFAEQLDLSVLRDKSADEEPDESLDPSFAMEGAGGRLRRDS